MNCNGCYNLVDKKCKLGKHTFLNPVEDKDIIKLSYDCIFKNTQRENVSFIDSHNLAKVRIAIASYFILTKENINDLTSLIKKEDLTDTIIGQFNVVTSELFPAKELEGICQELGFVNGKRLWNFTMIPEYKTFKYNGIEIPDFIPEQCKLPYFMILKNESDFIDATNFKFRCFSNIVPKFYGNIVSTREIRRILVEESSLCLQ